jgi:hypothetical protein
LGWLTLAVLSVGILLALDILGAAAVLYFIGWMLHVVLVALPRWIAGLWT